MRQTRLERFALAALLAASFCGARLPAQASLSVGITLRAFAQLQFMARELRVELPGCLYGALRGNTIAVEFLVPATSDPRTASDSSVLIGSCPNVVTTDGVAFIGTAHSHIRPGSLCEASGHDREHLRQWRRVGALVELISCARGDSIAALVNPDGLVRMIGAPPIDSLYHEVNR